MPLVRESVLISARLLATGIALKIGMIPDQSKECQASFFGPLDNKAISWNGCGLLGFNAFVRKIISYHAGWTQYLNANTIKTKGQ